MFDAGWANYRFKGYQVQRELIADGTQNANAIVAAPGAGLKIVLLSYVLSASGAVNAKWQSGSTDKTGLIYMAAAGATVVSPRGNTIECAANEALNLHLSAATTVGGHIEYIIVPSDA